jgi:hypothetical protein
LEFHNYTFFNLGLWAIPHVHRALSSSAEATPFMTGLGHHLIDRISSGWFLESIRRIRAHRGPG